MNAENGSAPVARRDRAEAETAAKAALRQAVWEAAQFMTDSAVRAYVDAVLYEVESDAP